ncbi:MAG: class I SAM-dependent methyltransferase [Acidobacteriia bacterium]|nr:class I SAM-dependent methyltransferase [Terriglobia bacterium]
MLRRILLSCTLLSLVAAGPILVAQTATQQHHPPESTGEYIKALEDPGRDAWQQPDLVIENLGLHTGDEVADLGAGSGYFTVRLAREVGPSGKVYAVDIDRKMLDYIERRAQEEKLDNIQTILADPNDPKLGSQSVDLIFICDVLHHIQDRDKYYPKLYRALRPGGRLVNVDFQKRKLPLGPPLEMKIDKKDSIKEIEAAGFHFEKEFDFLKYQYFLVFAPEE